MPDRSVAVIVAIPRQEDHVWDISSEKIPHMTLLYLGKPNWGPDEKLHAAQFVEHASDTISRFGMSVERRGTLGDDDADVLYFEKDWMYKRLEGFRSDLRADNTIDAAYNAVDQFPEWNPHLTLGYPESPAKSETRDYPISWVEFDRIALWTGDFEGPTFQLKTSRSEEVAAMSAKDRGAEFIEHYGVKGMRWGVKKARSGRNKTIFSKSPDKLSDAELTKRIQRLEAEKKYNDLNRRTVGKGEQLVAEVLQSSGRRIATTVVTNVGTLAVGAAVASRFGTGTGQAVTRKLK